VLEAAPNNHAEVWGFVSPASQHHRKVQIAFGFLDEVRGEMPKERRDPRCPPFLFGCRTESMLIWCAVFVLGAIAWMILNV